MDSARISMSLDDYNKEIKRANVQGCIAGQKNIMEIFNSFEAGTHESIEFPKDMNAEVKRLAIEFIDKMMAHFNIQQEESTDEEG